MTYNVFGGTLNPTLLLLPSTLGHSMMSSYLWLKSLATLFASLQVTLIACRSSLKVAQQVFCGLPGYRYPVCGYIFSIANKR